jgi:CheY-like chemotaxis protein
MKIAWIDDDTPIIEPVMKPIIDDGHEIIRFKSAKEVIDSIETIRKCDLIIMDMIIPTGRENNTPYRLYSGVQILSKLRREYEVKVPVFIFSVVDKVKVMDQMSDLGVAEYIRKPALQTDLKRAVDSFLYKK